MANIPGDEGDHQQVQIKVNNQFKLGKKIGSGSFGEIYLGFDTVTNREVAVKFEQVNVRRPQLIEKQGC